MTTMMKRAGKHPYDMRRGDSYVLPHDRRRIAVGLRWAASLSSSSSDGVVGSPLDLTVFGSCTLLDAKGNLITTLSALHTTNDHTGNSIRFVPDPIFDFPLSLVLFFFVIFCISFMMMYIYLNRKTIIR